MRRQQAVFAHPRSEAGEGTAHLSRWPAARACPGKQRGTAQVAKARCADAPHLERPPKQRQLSVGQYVLVVRHGSRLETGGCRLKVTCATIAEDRLALWRFRRLRPRVPDARARGGNPDERPGPPGIRLPGPNHKQYRGSGCILALRSELSPRRCSRRSKRPHVGVGRSVRIPLPLERNEFLFRQPKPLGRPIETHAVLYGLSWPQC